MANRTPIGIAVRAITTPAAGAEISYTISDSDILLRSMRIKLVTDSNAATRNVRVTFEDSSGNVYAEYVAGVTQIASLTRYYGFNRISIATPTGALDTTFIPVSLPSDGVLIPKGGKIKTVTTSIQVGDQYTGVLCAELP